MIGYCSGGRQSVLAACNLDLDAAVDCYGAFVTGTPPDGLPAAGHQPRRPAAEPARPRCSACSARRTPYPSPEQVAELDEILTAHGKPHEFHSYDDAGHGFFAVDRPSYRVAAANDGWERIAAFFATPPRELTMCTYATDAIRDRRQRQGTGQHVVPRHRRHGLLRPPRARDGRAHPQHRLREPGAGPSARVAVELTAASAANSSPRSRPRSTPEQVSDFLRPRPFDIGRHPNHD